MNRIAIPFVFAAALLAALAGCRYKNPSNMLKADDHAVYYWRTWYSTNDYER